MKFSFVIPSKNEEKYISRCLDSIRKQKGSYEIIVIDSSSDKTLKIARKYTKKAFFEKTSGVSLAKNVGAKKSSGEYLIFLDADSYVPAGFLEGIEKAMSLGCIGGCVMRIKLYDSRGPMENIMCSIWNEFVKLLNFLRIPVTPGCAFVCRKDIFRKIGGFNQKLVAAEDHDIARRFSEKGRLVFLDKPIVYTSARRIYRLGIIRFFYLQFSNSIKYFIFGKSEESYWS